MARALNLIIMSLLACLLMSLLGISISIGRAENSFPSSSTVQDQSVQQLVSEMDWLAPPLPPSPEYLDKAEESVVVPRPPRPVKGIWENMFFSGIELTTDFIKAFPTHIFDMIPFPGNPIYVDSETSLPDNVRSRAYDVINKAEKVENDWSKSADSKPANFDGISESLGWPQTLDSDELGSGGSFLNGAEFESDASIALAPATTVIRGDANPKLNPLDNTDIVDAKSTKARENEIEELVSGKVKRDLQEIATDAGVATLKHYIKKFDLVPKMLKQILNPGTLRGGPQFNHYRDPLNFGSPYSQPRAQQELHYQEERRFQQQQGYYQSQRGDRGNYHTFNDFQADELRPNLAYGEIGRAVPLTSSF